MKRLLLASALLAIAGQAFAADLPTKMALKAPLPPPAYSWTGCYLGGHIGGGWGNANFSEPDANAVFAPPGGNVGFKQDAGFLGGGQVGCDYETASHWVLGLAGDASWTRITGQGIDPFFAGKFGNPITLRDNTDWLATATGRLGYAWDRWMLYVKGGAAWDHSTESMSNLITFGTPPVLCATGGISVACNATGSETRLGWTAGLGLTWAFANHWSAGLEYDLYGFGRRSVTLTSLNVPTGSPSAPVSVGQWIDAVKFTLDYHFGNGRY